MALIVNGITAPTGTELNTVKTNLTSLAMRQLRAKYSLVDMIVDEFTDTTGIDTSASNEDALVYDSGYFGCYGTHTTVTTFDINGVETRDGTIQTLTTSFPGASNRTIVIEAWGGRGGASSFSWTQTYNREDSLEENLEYAHNNSDASHGYRSHNKGIASGGAVSIFMRGMNDGYKNSDSGWNGGFTVRLKGTYTGWQGGETLLICVGKAGNSGYWGHGGNSGGGGMSAIILDHGSGNNIGQTRGSGNSTRYTPILVAGGGGGAAVKEGYSYNQGSKAWLDAKPFDETDAHVANSTGSSKALTNASGASNCTRAARTNGQGGDPWNQSGAYPGGGGAGWNTIGADGTAHNGNGQGGMHLTNSTPFYGGLGLGSYGNCSGGFGGGGSGNLGGAGGGGGFSGGSSAGMWSAEGCNGAGGGSLFGYTTASGGGYNNTIGVTENTNVEAKTIAHASPTPNGGHNGRVIVTQTSLVNAVNATLVSNATTASSTPSKTTISIGYSNGAGTATINTDIKGWVSKDGGSNWVQATLVDKGSIGTYNLLIAHDIDISDATSNQTDGGVAMKWKITTHNQASGKYQRLHSVALGWK